MLSRYVRVYNYACNIREREHSSADVGQRRRKEERKRIISWILSAGRLLRQRSRKLQKPSQKSLLQNLVPNERGVNSPILDCG